MGGNQEMTAHVHWVCNARWTIMMILCRTPPSPAEEGRGENIENLTVSASEVKCAVESCRL